MDDFINLAESGLCISSCLQQLEKDKVRDKEFQVKGKSFQDSEVWSRPVCYVFLGNSFHIQWNFLSIQFIFQVQNLLHHNDPNSWTANTQFDVMINTIHNKFFFGKSRAKWNLHLKTSWIKMTGVILFWKWSRRWKIMKEGTIQCLCPGLRYHLVTRPSCLFCFQEEDIPWWAFDET